MANLNRDVQEYNYRQIKLMEQKIESFLNSTISIIWLINDLYALLLCIQNPPEIFFQQFKKAWSKLEICYACAYDEERNYFTEEEHLLITKGILEMKKLISVYKNNYLAEIDQLNEDENILSND